MEEDKRKTYEDTISDLIQDVRNTGEYLANHAEDLVCKAPLLAEDGFNIWLRFNANIMTSEARKILNHRNGTLYEDLMFIDIRTGEYITRTDYNHERKVMPSERMRRMINKAPEYTIATLRNHPGSAAPSPDDIHTLHVRKNAYGVVACHDGTWYKYSVDRNNFNEAGYAAAFAYLDKNGYNETVIAEYVNLSRNAGVKV